MPIEIKYTGTQQRWPELATTGKQSVWMPGQIEERDDVEAGKLLATGLFKTEPVALTATRSDQGVVKAKAGDIVFATLDRLGPSYVESIGSANPNDGKMRIRSLNQDADFPVMLEAAVPNSDGTWTVYQVGREGLDGFMRQYGSYVARRKMLDGLYLSGGTSAELGVLNVAAPSGGGWQNLAAANPYALTIGDSFSFTFTGTGFDLRSYVDNRGGAWSVTVDGVNVGQISVWNATAIWDIRTGPRGLTHGPHTVVMTFVGGDGVHAPVGGVPRGWIARGLIGTGEDLRAYGTIRIAQVMEVFEQVQRLGSASSNVEGVIESKKVGAAYATTKWPWHGPVAGPGNGNGAGSTAILAQSVYVDGAPIDPSNLNSFWRHAYRIEFAQTFTAQNLYETAETLFRGVMQASVTGDGYSWSLALDTAQNVTVTTAYGPMLAMDLCDRAIFNSGAVQNLSDHSAQTMYGPYAKVADSGMLYDPAHGYALAYEIGNWQKSCRVGRPGAVPNFVYSQTRTAARLSKVYNYIAPVGSSTWYAGERIEISGRIRGGVRPAI